MASKKRPPAQRSEKDKGGILGRSELRPVLSVTKNGWNPNEMTAFERASLKHGLQTDGWVASQALLVWGTDDKGRKRDMIMDGENRWVVAQELGTFDLVPMVVLDGLTEAEAKAWTLKLARRGRHREDLLAMVVTDLSVQLEVPDLGIEIGIDNEHMASLLAYSPSDLDGAADGAGLDGKPRSASRNTRVAQLFFDAAQHERWQAAIAELAKKLGKDNVSETALEAVTRLISDSRVRTRDMPKLEEGDVPETIPKRAVTKPGDVWVLGDHRLLCGDCAGDVSALAVGLADLLVTDPPYGVAYADKNKFLNAVAPGNRIQVPISNDHSTPAQMSAFWSSTFRSVRAALRPGAAYYVTGPQGGDLLLLLLALRDSGFPLRHMLVWVKDQFVLGRSDYHYQHEPVIYGWVDGAGHHAVKDRGESSTWEIPRPRKSDLHPTMKPVELYARAIRNSSDDGQLVYDPFAGSGTAFVACEQLDRRCAGVEITPAYCDVIVERWQSVSGKKARRLQRRGRAQAAAAASSARRVRDKRLARAG